MVTEYNIAFFQIYYIAILLSCFIAILQKVDILMLPQFYNNNSAELCNRFAILQCFNEIILQYAYNLSVLYGIS